MLFELGVLPPKQDECNHYIERILNHLPSKTESSVKVFIESQRKTNLNSKTIFRRLEIIKFFDVWISAKNNRDLYSVGPIDIQNYLNNLKANGYSHSYCNQIQTNLSIFYRWLKANDYIFFDPLDSLKIRKEQKILVICNNSQVDKIFKFIKNPTSNPEQAILLALVLVWGFRGEDISFAQIEVTNDNFKIVLRRKTLTTTKQYNREQILELPRKPLWFHQLQKRFFEDWLAKYKRLNKNAPKYYLFLPRYRSVWPLTKTTITSRVYEATIAAVGIKIPLRVLRKTCGHLHTTANDSSLLARLGWSPDYCFNYTWVQKIYFNKSE